MSTLGWILVGGLAMSVIALAGSLTLVLPRRALRRMLLPLVGFAAGALIGGALFHMLPSAAEELSDPIVVYLWFIGGFVSFYVLEQFLHWHHCHRGADCERQPMGTLILAADGLHNLIGGLAVGASFVLATPVGISAWMAAAAHEVPQELGDFGVLVHSGWGPRRALLANLVSALTFPLGALAAYWAAGALEIAFLVPFAAGNFVYIGATDLIPQLTVTEDWREKVVHTIALLLGLGLLLVTAVGG
ncbi:MAG TPA: ZIP family metal transporter [Actinomycetota bacterium]